MKSLTKQQQQKFKWKISKRRKTIVERATVSDNGFQNAYELNKDFASHWRHLSICLPFIHFSFELVKSSFDQQYRLVRTNGRIDFGKV